MKTKILVVDDSSSDRLIIEKMLGEFDVLTAQDGADALRLIDQQPDIELMILDLNMPVMDGFQVLQILKEQPRHQSLRTIILTNYDELDNEIRGLELGAVDYIRKPIHMSSLKIRVETQMQLLQVRQSMEQKLRDQDLIFDTIFYQAPIGIAISHNMEPADEAVSLRGQINPMLEEITGRSAEELIRLGWAAVTHPDDLAEELP
ncbi:MAG: response regulator, partial [Eubacteriales bacterium]|nr:response regulator [Eubacteriales bacterium]